MNRKDKLQKVISESNAELWRILREERLEEDKKLVGKFMKGFEDVSRSYTIYVSFVKIGEFENLLGTYFKIFSDSSAVEFSQPGKLVDVDSMDQSDYEEISPEEYIEMYKRIIENL